MYAVAAVLAWSLALPAHAQEASHQIVPEDYFSLDTAGGLTVDRTGARVAFVRSRWNEDEDRMVDSLWMIQTRRREVERLTFDEGDAWSPRFSSDGSWLYHLAVDNSGSTQVFRMSSNGGPRHQLTHATRGVDAYQVTDDGSLWYLATHSGPRLDSFEGLRAQLGEVIYADAEVHEGVIHRVDLSTWRDEVVFQPGQYVMEFEVSPDGNRIATLVAPDAELVTHEGGSDVVIYDRSADRITRLQDNLWRGEGAPSPYGWLLGLAWSSDSRALAFRIDFDGYPGETFVTEFAEGEPNTWQLPRPREITPMGGDLKWVPGQRELCLRAAERARVKLLCISGVKGGTSSRDRTVPEGNAVVSSFTFSADGRDLVATVGTPEAFTEIYRLPARGRLPPIQLTNLNPHTRTWNLPDMQLVSWKSADGTEVSGILETPAGWTPEDGPLPLLLQIHGGPTAHTPYMRRFRIYGQTAFAAKGWAMLSPNYRGSVGYGDRFITDLVGHENDVDVADLTSGVDAMIARGIADADRLAVMGWSNGGYLTNCLISRTDRFKVASSGAGVFDQGMQWALEDTPGHVINFMQGLPWQRPDESVAASPMYGAKALSTPTLIHFGEHDARVPIAHGLALHRALDFYSDVPTELITYPGAGHGLGTWTHRYSKMRWDHAWFDHWISAGAPEAGAPSAEDAPVEDDAVAPATPSE